MTNLSFAVTALSQVFMIFQGLSQGFACSPLAGFVATDLSSFSAGFFT